ncbi:MAG: DUF1015 domain-containing protein [Actinomycetota bacterium]|nr:DUF1015 domain-containing protein [Actinomycetota bacterium]
MPRLDPFTASRYRPEAGHLDALIAPPYDVVTAEERARLVGRSEHNAARLEIPAEEEGRDRYLVAASLWQRWHDEGILAPDQEPSLYLYRMGFHDEDGRPQQTSGVMGALELSPPGQGVLPHEHTTAKDKSDRLALLRACRANLSPIWVLSPTAGLSSLLEPQGPPVARATDDQGVHHRLWALNQPAMVATIADAVASVPVVVADGHHRYETALAYQEERRAATSGAAGAYDAVLACVVELSQEQLAVRPIHRLLSGLGPGFDLAEALSAHFEVTAAGRADTGLPARMAGAGSLGLVTPAGAWLLRPRPETVAAAVHSVDSSLLDVALPGLPAHRLVYQHGLDTVLAAVTSGAAEAAILLRPATVAQIGEVARGGDRMPPKTTFFEPKLRTGMVFRAVPG